MSRYRKLMSEAITEVRENAGDYLKSRLTPAQIQNIKNTWKTKKASDVTQSVKDMIKKMDIPTQLAIKHADIPHLSKLVEEAPVEIDEGRMKDIYTMDKEGKSAEEIAKKLKVSVSSVKAILGEEAYDEITEACWTGFKQVGMKKKNGKMVPNCVPEEFVKEDTELNEFSMAMLDKLAKEYEPMRGKTISVDNANKLRKIFDRIPDAYLQQIRKKKIPFLSALALSRMIQKGIPVREDINEAKEDPNAPATDTTDEPAGVEIAKLRAKIDKDDKKEVAKKEGELEKAKDEIAMLKTKLENEKNKAVKPEPNPETGEVPLAIGLAQKLLRDKQKAEQDKAKVNENVFDIWKEAAKVNDKEIEKDLEEYEEEINDKELEESTAAVRKKAEKSGMPYGILKKVYDRGMAAWRGGHRPGATQVQWALARVNSFVTKSSGTWGGADKDLAKQVRGSKKEEVGENAPTDADMQRMKKLGMKPQKEELDSKDKPLVKKIITKLKGASQAHAGQAKELDKALKSEDLDAQPQDKDVKKKDGTQPKKYYKSLSKDTKNKRADHFKSKDTTKNDNQPAPGDKDAKTKPSIHTQKYKKMFGEDFLNEKNATITINKITKPAVHRQISDVIKKMGSKAPKVTKTANGYVMAGDVKSLTGVVDYLFDKELRNIINPKNPPFDIKMLKNDMSEADLTKSQIKKVHDKADELPKKDFKDRYGKEKGDDVRYAVATNIIKKKLGIK